MSSFVIIDAGPSLTFYAAGKHELLHATLEAISHELAVPEIVQHEVFRKSKSDQRFKLVADRFTGDQQADRFTIMSDNQGTKMARVVASVQRQLQVLKSGSTGAPLTAEDLGEATVVAHSLRLQADSQNVRVLIDEWRGQQVARQRGLSVIDTGSILNKAARLGLITDRGEMRKLWEKLRGLDLSLVHWDQMTRLHDRSFYGSQT